MALKNGVKNIQAAGYNGTGTVFGLLWLINVQFGANQMRKNVRNHVKLGVSLKVFYCVAMGLTDLWGNADLHCQKVESTKWLRNKLRATY